MDEGFPLLREHLNSGAVGSGLPNGKREPRCGPWDKRDDGASVCRKCGEVEGPLTLASGPFGI